MSRWDDERERRREFDGDVAYEAWRRGLNPDRAVECADGCYYDGCTATECVDGYQRRVQCQREAAYQQEQEQQQDDDSALGADA